MDAFAAFQLAYARAAADASGSGLEVRLLVAEIAASVADTGEGLNLLAKLLGMPDRAETISPEAARAVRATRGIDGS